MCEAIGAIATVLALILYIIVEAEGLSDFFNRNGLSDFYNRNRRMILGWLVFILLALSIALTSALTMRGN